MVKDVNVDKIWEAINQTTANIDKLSADVKELREASWKTETTVERMAASIYEFIKKVDDTVGDYGDRLGTIMELVVIPGVRPALHRLGRNFDRIVTNKKIKDPDGKKKLSTEIDVLLINGTEAMAVEIKTHLIANEVTKHVERLKKLRKNEDKIDIKDKTLYGAVAGIVIDKSARKQAIKEGLYLIEILEDKSRLNAIAPPAGKIATW